jgi:hypothetical protein
MASVHCQSIRPSWPAELGTELQQWTTGVTDSRPMSGVVLIGPLVAGFKVHQANYLRRNRPDKEENGGPTRLDGEAARRKGSHVRSCICTIR